MNSEFRNIDVDTLSKFEVLIVDDLFENRLFLKKIIQSVFNCGVFESSDGIEALEFLKTKIPTLIILDINMPRLNGYDFLKTIRNQPLTRDIPVIICTTVAEKNPVMSLLVEGVTDYILKPIDIPLVIQKVGKFIKKLMYRTMKFRIDNNGIGFFFSDPFAEDFIIRIMSVEGVEPNDSYDLQVEGVQMVKGISINSQPVVKIPAHDKVIKLKFSFYKSGQKEITVFFITQEKKELI
jgi:CheY-like chemotaxis protein